MVKNTWLAPGMIGYVELEVGTRCTEGIFLQNEANKNSQYLYPGIVYCEPDQQGNRSEFIISYTNPSIEYVEINTETVVGHLDPSEAIPYQVPHSHILVRGVTIKSSNNISEEAKLEGLVTLVNHCFLRKVKKMRH